MSRPKVVIHLRATSSLLDQHDVLMEEALIKKMKVPTHQYLTLRFGSSKSIIKIIPDSKNKGLNFSRELAQKLSLHEGAALRLHFNPSLLVLNMGPVIAVLMSRYGGMASGKPFGVNTAYCQELAEASQIQGGFVYFLTPKQIDTSKALQSGWCYYNGWRKMSFPYPDVVHNRLGSRKQERSDKVQSFVKMLKNKYNSKFFNEKFLNKSEVFQALKQTPALRPYLPESYPFRNYQMLKTMCRKYTTVFLKPITGSLGKGIIKIIRQPGNTYTCHFSSINGTKKINYSSLPRVFRAISGLLKSRRYQIQQGLNLITNHGRPVDFRVLVQKNLEGTWSITSRVARIAGSEHFVSNLARGGKLRTVKGALASAPLPANQKKNLQSRLSKAALLIANGLETNIPHHFGELGVDLAIDRKGSVWLLEVNSKPSKSEDTTVRPTKIRPSVLRIIQYSRYLTKM